jgi:Zn-dependent protease with chaperone function
MNSAYQTTAYRYPNELPVLGWTLALVLAVIVLTAAVTLCGSLVFVLLMVALSFAMTRSHHQALVQAARRVTGRSAPGLNRLVEDCQARLQPGPIEVFAAPNQALNAYTFGLTSPKVVVVFSGLLQVMDEDELRFIIGHELGHVRLGHTWLNSLIGGMAGIPSPFMLAALLALAFRGWNRACEFSADRAGLLACGRPEKAVSALVKLVAPRAGLSPQHMQLALRYLDAEDDDPANLVGELVMTHPLMIRRIQQLRSYARSEEYRRLQSLVDRNLAA